MTTSDEIQPILDYTARDFDSIRSMLVGIAKGKMPEWETAGEANDFGTLMLELYAYMGDVTNYYIDRVSSEAFLGTAQRRQSVLYISEMLGYKPLGQQAATVLVTFSLSSDYDPVDDPYITIPSGTTLATNADSTEDIVWFSTDYTVVLYPGESVEVSATEGAEVTEFFGAASGAPNYEIMLANPGVVNRTVQLRTKEGVNYGGGSAYPAEYVDWFEVDAVSSALPTQSAFSTYLDDQGYTHVLFGDGAAGRIPPPGADIEVTYRYGVGSLANDISTGAITNVDDTSLPSAPYLTVSNSGSPLGGSDPESIGSMRQSVPKASRIRSRAVTLADFNSLAIQVPGVAKAKAYGQTYSAVNVRIAPVGGAVEENLMASLRSKVDDYLRDKVLIGSTVYVEDVQWTDIWIEMELYVLDGFNQSQVESSVMTALENYLSFDNQDFGGKITIGNIYRRAMSVEGVDYVDVTTLRTETTSGVGNRTIPELNIARVHPIDESLGDDGNGGWLDPYGIVINSHGGLGS